MNSDARLEAAPELMTSVQAGVPDMRVQVFNAVFAPAGTPREVMDVLKAVNLKVKSDPQFLQDLDNAGAQAFTPPEPEKFFLDEVAR